MKLLGILVVLYICVCFWSLFYSLIEAMIARRLGNSVQMVALGCPPAFILNLAKGLVLGVGWFPISGGIYFGRRIAHDQYVAHVFKGWQYATVVLAPALPMLALLYMLNCMHLREGVVCRVPEGVVVTDVTRDGPASQLRVGDIVKAVGDRPIRNFFDYAEAWQEWESGTQRIWVQRSGERIGVDVERPPLPDSSERGHPGFWIWGTVDVHPTNVWTFSPRLAAWAFFSGFKGTLPDGDVAPGYKVFLVALLGCGAFELFSRLTSAQSWFALVALARAGHPVDSDENSRRWFYSIPMTISWIAIWIPLLIGIVIDWAPIRYVDRALLLWMQPTADRFL